MKEERRGAGMLSCWDHMVWGLVTSRDLARLQYSLHGLDR